MEDHVLDYKDFRSYRWTKDFRQTGRSGEEVLACLLTTNGVIPDM